MAEKSLGFEPEFGLGSGLGHPVHMGTRGGLVWLVLMGAMLARYIGVGVVPHACASRALQIPVH